MAADESTALIPVVTRQIGHETVPAVTAKELYLALQLNPAAYARWAKKNIVTNPFGREHEDWEMTQPHVETRIDTSSRGPRTQDYALAIDFAKRLAMMARSAKGEEVRTYFLELERQAEAKGSMPVLHDPAMRALVEMAYQVDAMKHELDQIAANQRHQDQLLIAQQQTLIDHFVATQQANTKADLALSQQQWITLRQYVFANKLEHQLPPPLQQAYGKWLTSYCREHNVPVSREPIADRSYDSENRYHVGTIEATLPGWCKRRHGQELPFTVLPHPTKP